MKRKSDPDLVKGVTALFYDGPCRTSAFVGIKCGWPDGIDEKDNNLVHIYINQRRLESKE